MDRDQLEQAVSEGLSSYQIADRLGKGATSVRYWLRKYNLRTVRTINPYKICLCQYCGSEVITTARKRREYCSRSCSALAQRDARWAKMDGQEDLPQPRSAKRYLINRRGHKCEVCGLSEWKQQPIALILDHIDGNSDNNSKDNLRLVCPNCDAQLPTYKGRNVGNGRFARRERYKEGKSY